MLMRDGSVAWKLPTSEALQPGGASCRSCNIFPPQVTTGGPDELRRQGRLPGEQPLPTTIAEGLEAFPEPCLPPGGTGPFPHREQEPARRRWSSGRCLFILPHR